MPSLATTPGYVLVMPRISSAGALMRSGTSVVSGAVTSKRSSCSPASGTRTGRPFEGRPVRFRTQSVPRRRAYGQASGTQKPVPSCASQACSEPSARAAFGCGQGVAGLAADELLEVVERRDRPTIRRYRCPRRRMPPWSVPAAMRPMASETVFVELLLRADDRACSRLRSGVELVDVHADGVDALRRRRPGGRRCRSCRRPGT